MGTITIVALGFLLGIRHAVDPDHVIAVGTIAARTASVRGASIVGALWGVGHTLTLLIVGGSIVVLRSTLSPRTALTMEFGIALMLIVLGTTNLLNARRVEPVRPNAFRPFLVGMVHGTAGSAAIALFGLATIRSVSVGVLYLLLFGLGTTAGMIIVTAAVVVPTAQAIARAGIPHRWMAITAGAVSLAFGLTMVVMLGGPNALFAESLPSIAR